MLHTSRKNLVCRNEAYFAEEIKGVPVSVWVVLGVQSNRLPTASFQEEGAAQLKGTFR